MASSALDFFAFKWLFKRRSLKSSKKQQSVKSPASPLSPTTPSDFNNKTGFSESTGTGTGSRVTTKLGPANSLYSVCVSIDNTGSCAYASQLKPSYSFDDVDNFLKMSCITSKIKIPKSVTMDTTLAKDNNGYASQVCCSQPQGFPSQCCPLCLSIWSMEEMHSITSCGCTFCKSCFSTYLTINIKENHDVPFLSCPDANCPSLKSLDPSTKLVMKNNLISPQEIEQFVDSTTYKLYEKFKLDWEVDNDPDRTWCPTPNCDNICVITKFALTSITSPSASSTSSAFTFTSTTSERRKLPFFCHKCDQTFCSHCRKFWHPGFPCQSSSEDDNLMLALKRSSSLDASEIKRCPRCSVWIERDEGCAQMMCRKCKHVFCWFCLQSLEDDFLLRHYDKGPCKNKLGHSRASVIWHRTQVIGIFAGFGILLLLASPLFLLAAPCILCCNCCCSSSCKFNSDEIEVEAGHGEASLSSTSSFDDDKLFGRRTKKHH